MAKQKLKKLRPRSVTAPVLALTLIAGRISGRAMLH
jgi:hypothetical protein